MPAASASAKLATLDPTLKRLLTQDKGHLETTRLPIITVSASFKEDLKGWYGLPENESLPDIVLSRAHYSMALAIATQAWGKKIDKEKAWIFDPTNYVSQEDWKKIQLTELVGKTLARHSLLKSLKDIIDKWGRNKLPILSSIQPSLLHVTKDMSHPILSLHIAAGNILAESGKTVLQVITDPHIRSDYLTNADRSNMSFCVFDHKTKTDFLEKSFLLGKQIEADKVIVTGPPVDPRVIAARSRKPAWKPGRPLKICITTGGLGTNKPEIASIFEQLLPLMRTEQLQLIIYCSTQKDIYTEICEQAADYRIKLGNFGDKDTSLRVFYHPQIVDANELLIEYGFPWADGFITKPSGDMAYDAAAAGCFILSLKEWGEWETNIRNIFEQKNISRIAQTDQIRLQLEVLTQPLGNHSSWITQAMQKTNTLDPLFTSGTQNIISAYQKLARLK